MNGIFMIRVAFIKEDMYNPAGMERVLSIIANALSEYFDIHIITYLQDDKSDAYYLKPQINRIKLKLENCNSNIKSDCYKILNQHLISAKYDVVVSMGGLESSGLTNIKDGSKKILWYHFSYDIYYNVLDTKRGLKSYIWKHLHTWYRSYIANKYDKVVVLCNEDKRKWSRFCRNVEYIYNPLTINTSRISSCDKKIAIAVGRLDYQKGFDYLIDAWDLVHKKHPDWKLNIWGEGGLREMLQKQIDSNGLTDVISLCGNTSDIESKYLESSLLICSSRSEAFGLMIAEAESCGLPIITYACPSAPKEIVEDNRNGYVIPKVGDTETMAECIDRFIENSMLRKKMGNESKQISDRFSIETITSKWLELINGLVND